ncbi:MAG: ribulose-phosphate 3-epimerase [Eubacteriales bacterium]|nr:ribulose-phosphate 3-epimerase [Eubacteriales bacterium]
MEFQLCPSILSADFNRLGEQLQILKNTGIKVLHIDVMDGAFVPSISFGMPVIRSIRKESDLFFDVHLMVEEPARYLEEFVSCGADSITVHAEACKDLVGTLKAIKDLGVKAGVSIKPKTSVEELLPVLDLVDMVLVMTVEPGFGGQKYIEASTDRIRMVRKMITESGRDIELQVDGGINTGTMETVMKAGANYLVAGSFVFKDDLEKSTKDAMALMQAIEEKM